MSEEFDILYEGQSKRQRTVTNASSVAPQTMTYYKRGPIVLEEECLICWEKILVTFLTDSPRILKCFKCLCLTCAQQLKVCPFCRADMQTHELTCYTNEFQFLCGKCNSYCSDFFSTKWHMNECSPCPRLECKQLSYDLQGFQQIATLGNKDLWMYVLDRKTYRFGSASFYFDCTLHVQSIQEWGSLLQNVEALAAKIIPLKYRDHLKSVLELLCTQILQEIQKRIRK
jgi:hypothetical protein